MNPAKSKVMGPMEWGLLVTLSVLWGGAFFFIKVAVGELPPSSVVLGRVGLAAIILNLVVYISGQRMNRYRRQWGSFLVMGAINNMIPFSLIAWGQTEIPSGLASILNATTPLFGVVLAHLLTSDERITANRLGGVLLGVAGVSVMVGAELFQGVSGYMAGQMACLAAALSYALAGIYGRRFAGTPPLITAAGQVTATSLMMVPTVLIVDRPWTMPVPGLQALAAVAGLAVFSTSVAFIIYFRILATAGATNTLLVTLLIPVSASILGMAVLGERLGSQDFLGMALIALGLAAIDGRPLTKIRELAGGGLGYRPVRPLSEEPSESGIRR